MSDTEELLLLENNNLKQMLQKYESIIANIKSVIEDDRHTPTYKCEEIYNKLGRL